MTFDIPPPPAPPQAAYTRPATNGLAIASLVLGWLSCTWLPAIVLGHVALRQIKQQNQQGRWMAITGCVLGYIGLGATILILILAASGGLDSQ